MKKILIIILFIIIIAAGCYAFVVFYNKENSDDKIDYNKSKLVLIDEYKNFTVQANYNNELFLYRENNNPIYGIINSNYDIIEEFNSKEKGFLSKNNHDVSKYYYVKNNEFYIIKKDGEEVFQLDKNTFVTESDVKTDIKDFEIETIYEPTENIVVIQAYALANNKKNYYLYLYDYKKSTILKSYSSFEKFGKMIMKDNTCYFIEKNKDNKMSIIDSKTFNKINEYYYDNIGYENNLMSDSDLTFIDSNNYIIVYKNSYASIIDFKGNIITNNEYDHITDISENDRYFVAKNDDNKYGLIKIDNESKIFDYIYDYMQVTKNYIIVIKDNKLTIYDKDEQKLKEIDIIYNENNITIVSEDLGKALIIRYYSDSYKEYIYYNNKILEASYSNSFNDLEDNLILISNKNGYDLYNNSLDKLKSITTNDKYYEIVKLSNKENKACILTKHSDIDEKNNYTLVNFTTGDAIKSNKYDCMNLNNNESIILNINKIKLEKSNGQEIKNKIYEIKRLTENTFEVEFNSYTEIYKYVTN